MTNVVRVQVTQLLLDIGAGNFDENTIRSLYGHLRELARPHGDSLTLDIGDFFAHPERKRNKGVVKRHLEEAIKIVVDCMAKGEPPGQHINSISFTMITRDLDRALERLRLPPLGPRTDFAFALFAAFQGKSVKLLDGLEVRLTFFVRQDQAGVAASFRQSADKSTLSFPLFTMPNAGQVPKIVSDPFEEGWSLVRVKFDSGKLNIFQTHEFIEKGMLKTLRAHPDIPWRTPNNIMPGASKATSKNTDNAS